MKLGAHLEKQPNFIEDDSLKSLDSKLWSQALSKIKKI